MFLKRNDIEMLNYKPKYYFCDSNKNPAVIAGQVGIKVDHEVNEQFIELNSEDKIRILDKDGALSYEISGDSIGGASMGKSGLYMISFTCNVCEHRQSKTFTKQSYHNGVV